MKKIIPLILLFSLQSNAMTHEENYQKQIDFYKRMYEREKVRTDLIEKNLTKIKEVNNSKDLYHKYKNTIENIPVLRGNDSKIYFKDKIINVKVSSANYPNNPVSSSYSTLNGDPFNYSGGYGDFYNIGHTLYSQYNTLNWFTYKYNFYTEKKNIIKENLIQNLYDLADLIEDYTHNTIVEFDYNYNVYINDELLK